MTTFIEDSVYKKVYIYPIYPAQGMSVHVERSWGKKKKKRILTRLCSDQGRAWEAGGAGPADAAGEGGRNKPPPPPPPKRIFLTCS